VDDESDSVETVPENGVETKYSELGEDRALNLFFKNQHNRDRAHRDKVFRLSLFIFHCTY